MTINRNLWIYALLLGSAFSLNSVSYGADEEKVRVTVRIVNFNDMQDVAVQLSHKQTPPYILGKALNRKGIAIGQVNPKNGQGFYVNLIKGQEIIHCQWPTTQRNRNQIPYYNRGDAIETVILKHENKHCVIIGAGYGTS